MATRQEIESGKTGEEYVFKLENGDVRDEFGRMIYSPVWFKSNPSIEEVMSQEIKDSRGIGYQVPKFRTRAMKKLWWSVTDHECAAVPMWANITIDEMLLWLKEIGFTGGSRGDFDPAEWWDMTGKRKPHSR